MIDEKHDRAVHTGGGTLVVEDLVVRRGRVSVLDGVDFRLGPGVSVLLGENGAGKTTLLETLAGLIPPERGGVHWRAGDAERPATFGYQPQSMMPTSLLTVGSFVEHVAWLHRVPRHRRVEAVAEAIASVDLTDRRRVRLSRLSGGELRRACIAQAIVHGPDIVLLDEPSAGLDPVQHARLHRTIARLGTRHSVLLSTHQIDDVIAFGASVLVLRDHRVVRAGTLGDVVGPDIPATDAEAVGAALVELMAG